MTAQEVVDAAYRKNGVLNPSSAQDTAALEDLKNMLSSWSADGLVIPYYTTESFTLTTGQAVYTIGSGGDLDTVRPERLLTAFIRISNDDYAVKVNNTAIGYNSITSKDTEGRPKELWYDPQYPLGKIKFDYEADTTYAFHLISEKPLTNPTALGTSFSIPLEYNRPMVFNLAIEIAPDMDNKLPPEVFAIAENSYNALRDKHASEQLNEPATLDRAIVSGYRFMDINVGE